MRDSLLWFKFASILVCVSVILPSLGQAPADERAKIESLLKHVETLRDAKFVRNGKAYDAASAATFLRRKWHAEDAKVASAAEFIDKVATKSGTSGQPYLIRFPGGKDVKSGEYLREVLTKKGGSSNR